VTGAKPQPSYKIEEPFSFKASLLLNSVALPKGSNNPYPFYQFKQLTLNVSLSPPFILEL
jgi:hypothetical protein